MKKRSYVIVGTAAVLAVSLSGCNNYSKMIKDSPDEYIKLAAENTVKSIAASKSSGIYDAVSNAVKAGAVKGDVSYQNISVSFAVLNDENKSIGVNASVKSGDSNVTVKTYSDKDNAEFLISGLNEDHSYKLDLANFENDIKNSVFGPNSDSSYSLDDDSIKELTDAVNEFRDAFAGTDGENEFQKTWTDFVKSLEYTSSSEKVTLSDGAEFKANIIKCSVSGDQMKDVIDKMSGIAGEDSYISYYFDSMNEVLDSITNIDLTFTVNSKSHELVAVDGSFPAEIEGENYNMDVSLDFGSDPAKSSEYSLDFSAAPESDPADTATASVVLAMSGTDGNISDKLTFSAKDADINESGEIAFDYNKADGAYTLAYSDSNNGELKLGGVITVNGKTAEMTVDSVSVKSQYDDEAQTADGLSVKLAFTEDKPQPLGADKNFLSLTEDELDTLINDIMSGFYGTDISSDYDTYDDEELGYYDDEYYDDEYYDDEELGYYDDEELDGDALAIASANSMAKLAYTNFCTYATHVEINDSHLEDGVYICPLYEDGIDTFDGYEYAYDGSFEDLMTAMNGYMGMSDSYVLAVVEDGYPTSTYWSENYDFSDLDESDIPDSFEVDERFIGSYPVQAAS